MKSRKENKPKAAGKQETTWALAVLSPLTPLYAGRWSAPKVAPEIEAFFTKRERDFTIYEGGLSGLNLRLNLTPLSSDAQRRIVLEADKSYRKFLPNDAYGYRDAGLAVRCIARILLAIAREVHAPMLETGKKFFPVGRLFVHFRRQTILAVFWDKFPHIRKQSPDSFQSLITETERLCKTTPAWDECKKILKVHQHKMGRPPRKDKEVGLVRELRAVGAPWKDVANKVNKELNQDKTVQAYRDALRDR